MKRAMSYLKMRRPSALNPGELYHLQSRINRIINFVQGYHCKAIALLDVAWLGVAWQQHFVVISSSFSYLFVSPFLFSHALSFSFVSLVFASVTDGVVFMTAPVRSVAVAKPSSSMLMESKAGVQREEMVEGCLLRHGELWNEDVKIHYVECGDPEGDLVSLMYSRGPLSSSLCPNVLIAKILRWLRNEVILVRQCRLE